MGGLLHRTVSWRSCDAKLLWEQQNEGRLSPHLTPSPTKPEPYFIVNSREFYQEASNPKLPSFSLCLTFFTKQKSLV